MADIWKAAILTKDYTRSKFILTIKTTHRAKYPPCTHTDRNGPDVSKEQSLYRKNLAVLTDCELNGNFST